MLRARRTFSYFLCLVVVRERDRISFVLQFENGFDILDEALRLGRRRR
jgi:hypothetical protein